MQNLSTTEQVDDVLLAPSRSVIFKHSTVCPISRAAHREVALFCAERPEVPVYIVNVIEDRSLSRYLEEKTGIRHQSPQALVVGEGQVRWHASHYDVDADGLKQATK